MVFHVTKRGAEEGRSVVDVAAVDEGARWDEDDEAEEEELDWWAVPATRERVGS
jgi:hypothetical protein